MVVLQNFLILTISAACYKILLFFVHSYKSNSIIFDYSKLAVFGEKTTLHAICSPPKKHSDTVKNFQFITVTH